MYDEATDVINLIDFGAARDYPVQFVDNYLKMVSLIDDVLNSSFSVCSLSQIVPHRMNSPCLRTGRDLISIQVTIHSKWYKVPNTKI